MSDQIAAAAEEIVQKIMSRQTIHGHTLSEQSAACVVQDVLRKHFSPAASDDTPWISVHERLPEVSATFIVSGPIGCNTFVMACWFNIATRMFEEIPTDGKVAHWMPLPDPPAAPLSAEQILENARVYLESISNGSDGFTRHQIDRFAAILRGD